MASSRKQALATTVDPKFGFRHLDPMPARKDVHTFFEQEYYELVANGQKALDIRRAMNGGEEAERQRRWMHHTLYADIADTISRQAAGNRVLEVGCGLGDLLLDLKARGFTTTGIDISPIAANAAEERGLRVFAGAFETLAEAVLKNEQFDAILFVNVLEQMHDAPGIITLAANMLAPGGIVFVRSGNDFNPLQIALRDRLAKPEYWVVEDHIYYFDYASVGRMMEAAGLTVVHQQADFPMELFPLLGFDFIGRSDVGAEMHARRMAFEEALPTETRRRLYEALAKAGLGRCVFVAGRKPL